MTDRIHFSSQNFSIQSGSGIDQRTANSQLEVYFLDGARRPGRWRICPVVIPIARLPEMSLTEESLPEIFRLINHHTINVPYPLQDMSINIEGTVVFRHNHNGTHSARQVRYVQELFDLIQYRGTQNARAQMNSLSEEERLNLQLAAYLLRSGRVDESSHKSSNPDPYPRRSAMIYEEYARQLGVSEPVIEQTAFLIRNACLPKGVRDQALEDDEKAMFGYQVLTMAHELDLLRCFPKEKFDETTRDLINQQLSYFVGGRYRESQELILDQMLSFSMSVIEATGYMRRYDGRPMDRPLFAQCSTDAGICWERVQSVQFPSWARAL